MVMATPWQLLPPAGHAAVFDVVTVTPFTPLVKPYWATTALATLA